jgi:large subunit ribosomal protein L25
MNLEAQPRELVAKSSKTLRAEGFIPAEIYGRGIENVHVTLPKKEFLKAFKEGGSTTVINVTVEGKKFPVIVHDLQKSFLTDEIVHVDLYHIQRGQKIKAHVPVEFEGEAPAVKDFGAVVNKALSEIEVEALPDDMPHHIVIQLESLDEVGKSIHIKDVSFPKGVEVLVDPEAVIVSVSAPQEEEEAPATEAGVEDVVVESDEKVAERSGKEEAEK